MLEKVKTILHSIYEYLKPPAKLNWGYSFMALAISSAFCFALRCMFQATGWGWPLTSLAGYALFTPIVVTFSLILTTIAIGYNHADKIVGKYTGIGVLLISAISGIPIMLITRASHNLIILGWTSMRWNLVYPVYFYRTDISSWKYIIFEVFSDTVVPAIGVSLFFFGLMYSAFSGEHKNYKYALIGIMLALYSLDIVEMPGIIIAGFWCAYLRSKVQNIWGPFLCLLSTRLSEYLLDPLLSKIDIVSIQSYSDIDATYFYSSIPAMFVGIILLFYFVSKFGTFYDDFETRDPGMVEEKPAVKKNETIINILNGINVELLVGVLIFIILIALVIKGVHL